MYHCTLEMAHPAWLAFIIGKLVCCLYSSGIACSKLHLIALDFEVFRESWHAGSMMPKLVRRICLDSWLQLLGWFERIQNFQDVVLVSGFIHVCRRALAVASAA